MNVTDSGCARLKASLNAECARLDVAVVKPCAQFQASLQVARPDTVYPKVDLLFRGHDANCRRIYSFISSVPEDNQNEMHIWPQHI